LPIVAIAALVVLLIIAVLTLSALKPKKSATSDTANRTLPPNAGYPELPASTQMQAAMQAAAEMEQMQRQVDERRQVVLPPTATTPEREQALATVEQRPDAAIRVTKNWLRS
jgi:flagellar M-ring protein FliF